MSKKSNPDKGLRTVNIDFAGKNRQLKFSHTAIGKFEDDCNKILLAIGAVKPGMMIFADGIIDSWLGNAKILTSALWHCISDADLTTNDINDGIDNYIEAGGKKTDLVRAVIKAYRLATDPSILALIERNWKASDERQEILTEAQNQQIEATEKAIAEAKARLTPGSTSSDLPG